MNLFMTPVVVFPIFIALWRSRLYTHAQVKSILDQVKVQCGSSILRWKR